MRIGDIVTVVVDRAMGTYHPVHSDLFYPINYGYIEGVMAADGEEQDAYIVGVYKPLVRFTGAVIAIIRRHNDVEDKWGGAPVGALFSDEEIMEMVHFQEQFFDSVIER